MQKNVGLSYVGSKNEQCVAINRDAISHTAFSTFQISAFVLGSRGSRSWHLSNLWTIKFSRPTHNIPTYSVQWKLCIIITVNFEQWWKKMLLSNTDIVVNTYLQNVILWLSATSYKPASAFLSLSSNILALLIRGLCSWLLPEVLPRKSGSGCEYFRKRRYCERPRHRVELNSANLCSQQFSILVSLWGGVLARHVMCGF